MSPLAVRMLMHFHAIAEPYPDDHAAQREVRNSFIDWELIKWNGEYYTTTEKGAALVKMICDTPMPIQKWIDPRGEE